MEKSDKSKSSHESIDQLAMDIIHIKYQSIWNRLQVNHTRKWTSKTPQTLFPLQKRGLVPAVLATASDTSTREAHRNRGRKLAMRRVFLSNEERMPKRSTSKESSQAAPFELASYEGKIQSPNREIGHGLLPLIACSLPCNHHLIYLCTTHDLPQLWHDTTLRKALQISDRSIGDHPAYSWTLE